MPHPRDRRWKSRHPQAGTLSSALCRAAAETSCSPHPKKLSTASPYQVVELSAVSGIVAATTTDAAQLAPYRQLGITIYPARRRGEIEAGRRRSHAPVIYNVCFRKTHTPPSWN
jgi:hypothetical protein